MKHLSILFFAGIMMFFCLTNLFAQWEPDVRLTFNDAFSATSNNNAWCVASDGDTVHVIWYDNRDGNIEVYYKRSTDAGTTWEADFRLTDNPFTSEYPSIAVSGSNVHVVWMGVPGGQGEIYYTRSTDSGITWRPDTFLTTGSEASATVSGLNVHVVWVSGRYGNMEIFHKRSTDAGTTWESDTRLTADTSWSSSPSVAISGSNVHVVWHDNRDGNFEIYYKRSSDAGTTWEIDTRLTYDPDDSKAVSVAVSDSDVHVVWVDTRDGNYEIYYKRSTDGGTTWGTDYRLTDDTVVSWCPSVAVSGSHVHVVWHEDIYGDKEIYYKNSTDGGTIWETDTRLTYDLNESWNPFTAISGTKVHVIWVDNRDGNYEIYYKRNPTGNIVCEKPFSEVTLSTKPYLKVSPNPFRDRVSITLWMEDVGCKMEDASLKIYDVCGSLVKDFPLPTAYSLHHTLISWDVRDNSCKKVTGGVYFLKLQTGEYNITKKLLKVK